MNIDAWRQIAPVILLSAQSLPRTQSLPHVPHVQTLHCSVSMRRNASNIPNLPLSRLAPPL